MQKWNVARELCYMLGAYEKHCTSKINHLRTVPTNSMVFLPRFMITQGM